MAFETFKRQRVPLTTEPAITIQKRGNLSLNPPAYKALGSPEAVELMYDRERRLIGLRKTDPESEVAYLVRPMAKSASTWLISGTAFTAYYGIETDTARRWMCRLEGDMLVLDLSQPGVEVSSNRADRAPAQASSNGASSLEQLPGPVSGSPTAAPQVSRPTPNAPEGGGT
ncbi:MAG TPA: hypothetical protein VG010_00265 [Solirubrobacteraceae bacterium]|jgi:hypothetical protein|nr:hypothetical protein [Solirubrobacteraceae bacterium]